MWFAVGIRNEYLGITIVLLVSTAAWSNTWRLRSSARAKTWSGRSIDFIAEIFFGGWAFCVGLALIPSTFYDWSGSGGGGCGGILS